jgi:hypothetical protein
MHKTIHACCALACVAITTSAGLGAQLKLSTIATANVSTSIGASLLFDLTVNPAPGVWVTALETNSQASGHMALQIDVYTTPGGFAGKEGTASAWTKAGSGRPTRSAATCM